MRSYLKEKIADLDWKTEINAEENSSADHAFNILCPQNSALLYRPRWSLSRYISLVD
jgi:hypothetical protein